MLVRGVYADIGRVLRLVATKVRVLLLPRESWYGRRIITTVNQVRNNTLWRPPGVLAPTVSGIDDVHPDRTSTMFI